MQKFTFFLFLVCSSCFSSSCETDHESGMFVYEMCDPITEVRWWSACIEMYTAKNNLEIECNPEEYEGVTQTAMINRNISAAIEYCTSFGGSFGGQGEQDLSMCVESSLVVACRKKIYEMDCDSVDGGTDGENIPECKIPLPDEL